jgi:hypothetical protein
VEATISDPIDSAFAPSGEKDRTRRFFSEKINDIGQQRASLRLRTNEPRRVQN